MRPSGLLDIISASLPSPLIVTKEGFEQKTAEKSRFIDVLSLEISDRPGYMILSYSAEVRSVLEHNHEVDATYEWD
jgi:hypothetical protein